MTGSLHLGHTLTIAIEDALDEWMNGWVGGWGEMGQGEWMDGREGRVSSMYDERKEKRKRRTRRRENEKGKG